MKRFRQEIQTGRKRLMKQDMYYNNELTVSANSEKSSFLVNLGYLKNTGILKYTNYERLYG